MAEHLHIVSFDVRYGTEVFMVRAGYETSVATFYPDGGTYLQGLNEFINGMIQLDLLGHDYVDYFTANHDRGSFMGVGYQFDWNNIVSMGELVRRRFTVPFIANPIGWYLMGGYRVKNIMPHITYARERLTDNDARRFNSSVNNIA